MKTKASNRRRVMPRADVPSKRGFFDVVRCVRIAMVLSDSQTARFTSRRGRRISSLLLRLDPFPVAASRRQDASWPSGLSAAALVAPFDPDPPFADPFAVRLDSFVLPAALGASELQKRHHCTDDRSTSSLNQTIVHLPLPVPWLEGYQLSTRALAVR